ncbi:MAG: DUF58 domain-containing protein [Vicinamibacterales bacterium]
MAGGPRARQFLDPAVVARLGTLELRARTIVEGFLTGLHRSPFKGFSVEFAEYRQYIPGDDPSTIDWKVYARSDRHYVKKFEEETNLDCHILLDVSGSMGYGSRGLTKFEYAQCLAASLAYLMNRQRDGIGLTAFDEGIVGMLPASARAGHLRALLVTLERLTSGSRNRTNVTKPMKNSACVITKRGMVVLISDLLDRPRTTSSKASGTSPTAAPTSSSSTSSIHTSSSSRSRRATRFHDIESDHEVFADRRPVRDDYLKAIAALIDRYRVSSAAQASTTTCSRRRTAGPGADVLPHSAEPDLMLGFLAPAFLAGLTRRSGADRPAPAERREPEPA